MRNWRQRRCTHRSNVSSGRVGRLSGCSRYRRQSQSRRRGAGMWVDCELDAMQASFVVASDKNKSRFNSRDCHVADAFYYILILYKVGRIYIRLQHVPVAKMHLSPAATIRRMCLQILSA